MDKFCRKCGKEFQGSFCSNCGEKAQGYQQDNNACEVVESHNTFRLVSGIVMIFLGACLVLFSLNGDQVSAYENAGYNIGLVFTIPGIIALCGGVLSILSRKNNKLLLITGILYICAALCNMIAIKNISILFIVSVVFAIFDLVYYSKSR